MRPNLVALVAAVACVNAGGCGLLGGVRCEGDSDCPDSLPYCVDGACAKNSGDDGGRDACTADTDCGRDLCYDLDDDSDLKGACVPADSLRDDCATAQDEPTTSRDDEGPALISVTVGDAINGCEPPPSYSLTFRYFDREGDMPTIDSFTPVLFVRTAAGAFASASALFGSSAVGDDPTHAALIEYEACGERPLEDIAMWLEDIGHHRSNVVCATP